MPKKVAAAPAASNNTPAKKRGERQDYGTTWPKARVERLLRQTFKGRVSKVGVVGLTSNLEALFCALHEVSQKQPVTNKLAERKRLAAPGKPKKNGQVRPPRSEALLPKAYKCKASCLKSALNEKQFQACSSFFLFASFLLSFSFSFDLLLFFFASPSP